MTDAIAYFRRAVIQYNAGDVRALLDAKLPQAGPLLVSTSNGIDIADGACYGFEEKSGRRSVDFMVKHMGLHERQAIVLYKSVRCGMVHHGMPKYGINFTQDRFAQIPTDVLFPWLSGRGLVLNVTQFARSYLAAVHRIATEPAKYVFHVPPEDKAAVKCVEQLMKEYEEYGYHGCALDDEQQRIVTVGSSLSQEYPMPSDGFALPPSDEL